MHPYDSIFDSILRAPERGMAGLLGHGKWVAVADYIKVFVWGDLD